MTNSQLSTLNSPLIPPGSLCPKGYKQTEVGVIPEEWEVDRLGKVTDVKTGPFGSSLHESDYVRDGTPIITVEHLGDYGVEHSNLPLVSDTDRQRLRSYSLVVGDIVFSRVGSVDRNALIRHSEAGWLFSGRLLRVRPNKQRASAPFLSYQFHGEVFKGLVRNVAVGQTMACLNTQILKGVFVSLPPLPEQRAIATALSDVDGLLGGLDRLIAKKRDLKQAAMQALLSPPAAKGVESGELKVESEGNQPTEKSQLSTLNSQLNLRLPGFHGEWEETTFGQIGECIIGLTYKPENVVEHGLLVLRSSNVQNGRLAYDNNVHVNLQVAEHLYTQLGDILVCVRNGSRALIGKCAVIDSTAVGVTFGAFMSVYRTNYWRFVLYAFQGDDIQRQIRDNIGATINQITNKDMKAFRLRLPPEAEQTAIAEVLMDMDAELAALEQRREKTRALKQAMMQELLTGRVRLVS